VSQAAEEGRRDMKREKIPSPCFVAAKKEEIGQIEMRRNSKKSCSLGQEVKGNFYVLHRAECAGPLE